MKKVLTAVVLASALVASSTVAHAANTKPAISKKAKKPSIKHGAGAEGTATHEMSETSGTQSEEGTGAVKKHAKKAGTKKAAKATTK